MPGRQELPSTVARSPKKAQRTWIKAHDSAVETYGEGERAHREKRSSGHQANNREFARARS